MSLISPKARKMLADPQKKKEFWDKISKLKEGKYNAKITIDEKTYKIKIINPNLKK